MKINIYYGGRGLIEDPTIYVINKLTEVLTEVRASVTRYNLYEQKAGIAMLPNTFKDADAVILAASVEWFGVGGLMQQFLDACWLYGDRNKIKKLYMFPIVIATSMGEREAEYDLTRAWELLGGSVFPGICAYTADHVEFESNPVYATMIEKKAEDIYRVISQKMIPYPNSINVGALPAIGSPMELTPQESEQLSEYVSNETFVKKQKADVEQLAQMYLTKLDKGKDDDKQEFIADFKRCFCAPDAEFSAVYCIVMTDTERSLVIDVNEGKLKCYYGESDSPDVVAKTTRDVVNRLVSGRVTFQGAFMSSQLSCKGDFKLLRTFDQLFRFE